MRDRLWRLFHWRSLRTIKEKAQIGCIVRHAYGDEYQIVRRGAKGITLQDLTERDGRGGGFVAILMHGAERQCDWRQFLTSFEIVSSPGDSVSKALAEGSR